MPKYQLRETILASGPGEMAPVEVVLSRAERLDQLLFLRGFFPSREKARRAVMAGVVRVDGRPSGKPGRTVQSEVEISVLAPAEPFVSRAGRKLDAALDHFELDFRDRVCLDIGASTGGFTDCLLEHGASRVYAIDVGYGQLAYKLREDPRVIVMERVNARYLRPDSLPESGFLATFDLSFISLTKVVPAVLPLVAEQGWLLTLIKPQFEVGREQVGKGGIVRDPEVRHRVVEARIEELCHLGLSVLGRFDSPVAGAKGNIETFALFKKEVVV